MKAAQVQTQAQTQPAQHASGVLQRQCACGNHTSGGGECEECKKKSSSIIQRAAITEAGATDGLMTRTSLRIDDATRHKLRTDFASIPVVGRASSVRARVQPQLLINSPGDQYEQEADRIAESVTRPRPANPLRLVGPDRLTVPTLPLRITPFVQREAAVVGPAAGQVDDPLPTVETRLLTASGGRPLPPTLRERMEERFGVRFGGVRIHTGSEADQLAGDIEALAFTHGRDIYFASGAFAPSTPAGDRLLAHELTHVVQQSGGAATSAGQTTVQAARIRGPAFHAGTENRFLDANKGKGLVTEAPLPGATRWKSFDFEAVGFVDLYLSDVKDTAIGVRGKWETTKGVNPSDDPNKKRRYIDLNPLERTAKVGSGKANYIPTPQGDAQPFKGEFPERLQVGDIKPVWTVVGKPVVEGAGIGTAQLQNYQTGVNKFAEFAAADKKVKRGTIQTSVLTALAIPPELDYKNFEKENKSPSGNIIGTEGMTGRRRYWMFEPPGTGLYYYFHLAHPNPSPDAKKLLEETFKKLEPVKQELRTPDDGVHNKLNLAKLPKRRPNAIGRRIEPVRARTNVAPSDRTDATQVQRKDTPRVKKDWGALGRAWEQKRAAWDRQFAKPFLGSKEGKALDERVAINNAIGLKNDTSPGSIAEQGRHLKTIELWSGTTGVLLGKARFLLGNSFDKIAQAFDWMKGKLTGFWNKLTNAQSPNVGFGWRKTLVNLLIKAVKLGFREFVSVFFEMCANCLEGIIHKVVGKFTEEISEELAKQVEELRKQFERYEDLFKREFEQRFGSWDQFIKDLSTAQQWANILLSMEALIRLGLQAVSCLSPPALGCLWGLVAQVGLDVALSLIMGTEWFQQHVINHPSVRGLIKQFAGPTIRSLIADTLRGIGLEDYATGVEPCSKVKELEPPPVPPVDPIPPSQLQAHRAEWERVNRSQMLADLQFKFHSKSGVPATEAELEQLIAALGRSGKSTDELKEIIESTPKWSNGKYDLGAIRQRLRGDSDKPGPAGFGETPTVTKTIPRPPSGPRVRFGPLDPVPGAPGNDKGKDGSGAGVKIEF